MDEQFTLDQARALIPAVRAHVDQLAVLRADLADAGAALERGQQPAVGGLAEVKALEARLQATIDWFAQQRIQLKGIAPVIIDFPAQLHGEPVLLCWLEGEDTLAWYHRPELGFMGRRPLAFDMLGST